MTTTENPPTRKEKLAARAATARGKARPSWRERRALGKTHRRTPLPPNAPIPKGYRRTRKGTLRKRNPLWRWRKPLFLVGMALIVVASAAAYWTWNGTLLPDRDPPLLQTSFVCAADVSSNCGQENSIAQLSGGVDRVTVRYEQVPAIFVQALISAEDKDFFRHEGVDPVGVGRALYANLRVGESNLQQGGSTITQQYVKTVYLTNERTVTRKVREAILAVKLDKELPKQEILERYLNTIYFGRGAYGIEAASQVYFGKHVEQLGLAESAFLAGIVRAPETYDPNRQATDPLRDRQREAATDRRKQVLDAMVDQGYITASSRDEVASSGWDYVLPRTRAANYGRVARPELGTEYFLDYMRHWLVSTGKFTDAQIYGGGLRIYTTLDFNAQAAAYDAIRSTLDRPNDPAASIVSIDDKGMVRAMVGGFDYSADQVNLAVGAEGGGSGRQPGSSFKPFALAEYIRQGKSLGQVYNAPGRLQLKLPGETWTVANYGDAEQGQLNVVDATRKSSNTAYAQIMLDTGPTAVASTAEKLGITASLRAYPSLVLGTSEVSVLDMASAYSTFMDKGEHVGPYVVTKVTDAQGNVLWEADGARERVLTEDTAAAVSWVLNQVTESGTGTGARFGQPIAGKTGTTENYRDAWFVGYTCKLTAAVWVGYPKPDANGKMRYMQGVHGINVAGGTLPATIFRKYMAKAAAGLPSCPFPKPANVNVSPGSLPPGSVAPGTSPPGTVERIETTSTTSATTSSSVAPTTTETTPPTTEAPTSSTTASSTSSTTATTSTPTSAPGNGPSP